LKWINISDILRAGKSTRKYPEKSRYIMKTIQWICYTILFHAFLLQSLYKNWWSGNFILNLYPFDCSQYGILFYMDENYLVTLHRKFRLYIFCRQSFKLKHVRSHILELLHIFMEVRHDLLISTGNNFTRKWVDWLQSEEWDPYVWNHHWYNQSIQLDYRDAGNIRILYIINSKVPVKVLIFL